MRFAQVRVAVRLEARECPRGVLAHETLRVIECLGEDVDVSFVSGVPEHDGRIAFEAPQFRALLQRLCKYCR